MNSVTRAMLDFARNKAKQPAAILVFARDTASGFITTAHHTVMIMGIGAIAALALMFVKPDVADHLKALSPFHTAPAEQAPRLPTLANLMTSSPMPEELEDDVKSLNTELQQKRVTTWLAKRYRVAGDATDMLAWLPAASLTRFDLLYPDPWPKRRHWKRRFVQDTSVAAIARVVRPGGECRFASDIPDYVAWTLMRLTRSPEFAWTAERADDWRLAWPGFSGTRYEAKAKREGRVPCYLIFKRK